MKLRRLLDTLKYIVSNDIRKFVIVVLLSAFVGVIDTSVVISLGQLFGALLSGELDQGFFGSLIFKKNEVILGIIVMILLSLISNLILLKTSSFYSVDIAGKMSNRLVRSYNNLARVSAGSISSSDLTKNVVQETYRIAMTVLQPLVAIVSSGITSVLMTISLFILFPLETGLLVIGFTFLYTLIFISLKGRLRSAGGNVSNLYRERISILSDITQGMVDTRSLKLEEHFNIKFHLSSSKLTLNSGTVQFLSQVPKSVIESVLFVLILVFVYISEGDPKAFGVLATFGLASMKLLPVGQRIYHSIAQIAANISALREVRAFQDQMTKFQKNSVPVSASKLKNGDCIRINQLTLRYPGAKEVLGPFNFEMRIQSQVVFYGASGIGKSSIFSMLVGDIYPKEGQFFLNDVRVEHSELVNLFCNTMLIAQSSYVFRASLIENITGFDRNVDYDRYQLALNNACVPSELVERLAEAELGENALTLSGGQRQRVLIARGLYNICDTYFFDEITSALDKATALEVIANISHDKFNSICFFIAHDISLWADTDAECIEIVV